MLPLYNVEYKYLFVEDICAKLVLCYNKYFVSQRNKLFQKVNMTKSS